LLPAVKGFLEITPTEPYARVGVIGGVMLGLGRALGETMAVTFVIGNAHRISGSLLAPGLKPFAG
jgi:ABC-type phosphate transport system permease subunit